MLGFLRLLWAGGILETGSSPLPAYLQERRIRAIGEHGSHPRHLLTILLQDVACFHTSVLNSRVQLHPLCSTLASARAAGGHPRCPRSPTGHPVPEENQPQFCTPPSKTLCPHHSLCFIATLCKILEAACDLLLASDGTLGFKTCTHQAIERTL